MSFILFLFIRSRGDVGRFGRNCQERNCYVKCKSGSVAWMHFVLIISWDFFSEACPFFVFIIVSFSPSFFANFIMQMLFC